MDADGGASSGDTLETVEVYRDYARLQGEQELEKARRLLRNGKSTEEVAAILTRNLVRKLTHNPSVNLRSAVARGDTNLPAAVRALFGLAEDRDT